MRRNFNEWISGCWISYAIVNQILETRTRKIFFLWKLHRGASVIHSMNIFHHQCSIVYTEMMMKKNEGRAYNESQNQQSDHEIFLSSNAPVAIIKKF